ncbi:MAG: TolC family protein [Sphingobacteriaceae bacterium]
MKLVSIHKHFIALLFFTVVFQAAKAQVWTLQRCIDTAQAYNKNLEMGGNNIASGGEKVKEMKAGLLPKITANADYKYFINLPYQLLPLSTFSPTAPDGQFKDAQFGVPHNINANLQLTMSLYNPQVYGAIETTKIASELTVLRYQKTQEQIYFEISNLYYNAQILGHQITFIDSNLVNAEKLLKNIQLLNEQLLAKGTDVSKVKLQISQLETQKKNAGSRYTQVLNSLKFVMGVPIARHLKIDTNIQYQKTSDYASASILDIQIVEAQHRLLSRELRTLNNVKFLPSLNLIGMYGTTGFGYDKQPNNFLKFHPIGFAAIQISYPLFNGTVTQRKINQKKWERLNNELELGLINDQINMQIENSKLKKTIAKKSAETTKEEIELAKTIYIQTIFQQKQGIASLTDVLIADNALREAQQNYLSVIIDYLKADLEIKKLTGNLHSIMN